MQHDKQQQSGEPQPHTDAQSEDPIATDVHPGDPLPTDPWRQAVSDTTMNSGDGWAFLTGLQQPHSNANPKKSAHRPTPQIKMAGIVDGARVIRLSFRPGDVMADHRASLPILIFGQTGSITVTVGADTDTLDSFTLTPGTALSIEANKVHALRADHAATATLVVLTGSPG